MNFIKWFCDNWYANCFTLITVVLSGIISLAISALYYRKGNRNNLRMAVIHPIIRLLEEAYTRQNYKLLCEISKEYSVRYMSKDEVKKLTSLLSAYKEVSSYNDLQRLLNKIEPEIEPDEFKDAVISLYEHYCKKYYSSKKIKYFDDYTVKEVLKKSKIRQKWDGKFDEVKKAKEQFMNLKIVKDIV